MAHPFLRDLVYQRNQPEIRKGRNRIGRRKPIAGSNDQKGTYHQETPSQIQPSSTKKFDILMKSRSDASYPERLVHMDHGKQNLYYDRMMGKKLE
ncbi:hypothetical protein O181_049093 [Austropuccinia psidii MF-1]|uniref:Uncharacterized protein n=1 Tax=Austropuccinia psidii MF-1 TaxID=1389203 RepID=A0A9Q3HL31_9BASI|nr:hypothetical protein [Austropuccinia psidii MF-1]